MQTKISLAGNVIDISKMIIIFGACEFGMEVYDYLHAKTEKIIFVDNDISKKKYKGKQVLLPQEAVKYYKDANYIISSELHFEEMNTQLLNLGVIKEQIFFINGNQLLIEKLNEAKQDDLENDYFCFHSLLKKKNDNHPLKTAIAIGKYKYQYKKATIIKERKKFFVTICAIFKNEGKYLKEWIEYHRIIGVEHFYLYNNTSTDNYLEVLREYIDLGIVDLINWPNKQGQRSAYMHCINNYKKEAQWIGFIDIDEFVCPIRIKKLSDYLIGKMNYGSILIYWKMFGSSGKKNRNMNNLVTEDFYACWPKISNMGKIFLNTSFNPNFTKSEEAFHHSLWTELNGCIFPPIDVFNELVIGSKKKYKKSAKLDVQINHYYTRSYEEYIEKIARGDVFHNKSSYGWTSFEFGDKRSTSIDITIKKYLVELKMRMEKNNELL